MMGIILAIFGWAKKVYAAVIVVDTVVDGNASELAKVPKSDGTVSWNDTAKQAIQDECQDAIQAEKLDHLVGVADADDPVDNSVIAKLASKSATADWSSFDNTTDSLEAISDAINDMGGGRGQFKVASGSINDTSYTTLLSITGSGKLLSAAFTADTSMTKSIRLTIDGVVYTWASLNFATDVMLTWSNDFANFAFEIVTASSISGYNYHVNVEFKNSLLVEALIDNSSVSLSYKIAYNED